MKLQKINLGKVGITVEYDYWDYNKSYDKLTIVQDHSHNTFLSRKPVPKENDLNNRNYWIPVIQNVSLSELYTNLDILKQSLTDFKDEHQEDITKIMSILIEHGNSIENIIQTINEIQTVLEKYATISYVDNAIIDNINSLKQFISENYIKNIELESSINIINQNIQTVKDELQEDINHKIKETNDTLNEEIKNIKGDEYNTLSNLPTLSNLSINLQNNQLENNNKFDILDKTILNINKNIDIINKSNVSAITSEAKWGDSLTVNIKGVEHTIIIPNKPTLADLTNDLTSLGDVNAGSVNQPIYFKNGVPTVSNILQTNVYDSVFDYSTNGWEEIKGKMYGNRLAITKYRSNPPAFVNAHYDPILSFGNGDVLGFISTSVDKEQSYLSVGGGLNAHDAPWYWKLKGTNTATYTLPTKSSTLASIDDVPTKLSELEDDVVKGNYLPMAESAYDTTDTTNVLKHDGSWGIPELAEDLGGREETHHEEFFFQPTAGNDLSIKDGYAKIKSLKGNTIVWNQWVPITDKYLPNYIDSTTSTDVTYSDTETIITIKETNRGDTYYIGRFATSNTLYNKSFISHKYYAMWDIKNESTLTVGLRLWSSGYCDTIKAIPNQTTFIKYSQIVTAIYSNYLDILLSNKVNLNNHIGEKIYIRRAIVIDLTQMFGEGNEPTIKEFEAMYPDDYYEYNEGELRSFNGSAIKSIGFNQFNANSNEIIKHSALLGDGSLLIGNETSDIRAYSTLNNIKIFPNTTYYVHNIPDGAAIRSIALYDINKIFTRIIDVPHVNNNIHSIEGKTSFTTSENEHYCTLGFSNANKQNVCLNLSHSGYRNGQYEPYKESILQLPIKSIIDNNGDLLFPNGLRSAGTAYDEIVYDEGLGKYRAIKRIGSVDMGTLDWTIQHINDSYPHGYVRTRSLINRKLAYNNVLTTNYTSNSDGLETFKTDKKIIINNRNIDIYITDNSLDSYTSYQIKEKLQGQILYYELETPIEVILDDIDLSYEAWDFGTEELLYYTPSTPVITETQYNFNAVDMIRNNYFAIKALKETNPSNDLADVAFSGDYNDLENKPESIKNPHALTIIGKNDTTIYDGSETKTINLPTKTSDLDNDSFYSKTEVYTQSEVNDLINKISGVGSGIVDTWRPLIIQKNDGSNILSLSGGNTSGSLTLKAGNNITFANNDGIITVNNSYTLPAASNTLGGIKTGGDLILTDGIATVNGLSTIQSNANKGAIAHGWGNHAGNYPTYYGTGATGTWNININGDAKTIENHSIDEILHSKFLEKNVNINANDLTNTNTIYTAKFNLKDIPDTSFLNFPTNKPDGSFSLINLKEHAYNRQFYTYYYNNSIYTRTQYYKYTDKTNTWTDWKQLAFTDDIPTKLSDLTDDVVDGNYLPLSGGTINSSAVTPLTLKTSAAYCMIRFKTNSNDRYLGINNNGDLVVTSLNSWIEEYPLLHKNNYTSYINETNFPGINKTGTVTSIITGTGLSGGTITKSGTISLATVGTIAGSFGLSANTTPGYSGTFKVPYITVDNYGRVTKISENTVTMPSNPSTSNTVTKIYVGASGTVTNTAITNPYIKIANNGVYGNQIQLIGGDHIDIKSSNDGSITASINLPTASSSILGCVKIGSNINISNSIISVPKATTTTYGVVLPAGSTTDTGFSINNHKDCYHAVQVNGDGKLVVNIPKVYTVFKEISAITIGEKSKIVYTNTTTSSMTVKLNAGLKNSYTHLYIINNLNKPITITFNAEKVIGPKSITSSSSSGISVDLYVTDDGTIVIEPNNAN